jgi:hypothetical protein
LANLETLNTHFIHQGLPQPQRLQLLNQTAIQADELAACGCWRAPTGRKGKAMKPPTVSSSPVGGRTRQAQASQVLLAIKDTTSVSYTHAAAASMTT